MDLYARNSGLDGSESDPHPQWTETGLEDSMWRLGLTAKETYPERPGAPDCVYYMRTGICGFGNRCRYNHPLDRAAVSPPSITRLELLPNVMAAAKLAGEDYPERPGEPFCQYYLMTGTCKFGATCKFHHPRNAGGSLSNVSLNYHGYPLRPGEKECSYYLKMGQCRFRSTCKFHHPQPAGISIPATAPPFYPTVQSPIAEPIRGSSDNRVPRPPLLHGSYLSGAYGPLLLSPGVLPYPGWTSYSAPASPAMSPGAQPSGGASSLYGLPQLSSPTPTVAGTYPPLLSPACQSGVFGKEVKFPERPGQPECQYYLKTGDCKFGSSCRYHHPPERAVSTTACYLNPLGLPLRPGEQACAFYMQNGYCKFGPMCKFDHPMTPIRYNSSASSLTEMPRVPYMAGSSLPYSSPSLLGPDTSADYGYGSKYNPASSRISAGVLPFSQAMTLSLSNVQR